MKVLIVTIAFLSGITCLSAQSSYFNRREYGRHIASAFVLDNNAGAGIGVQYEQILELEDDDRTDLSFVLTAEVCYSTVLPHNTHLPVGMQGSTQRAMMILIAPGLRYYPTRSKGVLRYSLGVHGLIGKGKGQGHTYTNGTNDLVPRFIYGLMIINGFNLQLTRFIRLSLDIGVGIGQDNGLNSATGGPLNPLGQAGLSLGYRW